MLTPAQSTAPLALPIPPSPAACEANHIRLVHAVAADVRRRAHGGVEAGDLVGAGLQGLVEAAHRYQPEKGATFASFAFHRIQGAMRDELRAAALRVQTEPEPPDDLEDPAPAADELLAAKDAAHALERALDALSARERTLVERCFVDGVTLRVAARELGVSISRASRLRSRALAKLRARVERELG